MRSKQALKNMSMALLLQVFQLVMGLIMPRWIILVYGSTLNGLTSTINSLLSVISLLQAGAIGAAVYELYKPVSEKDYASVSRILHASDKYNRKIGYLFLVLSALIIPYFLWRQSGSGIDPIILVMGFVILCVHTSFSFFFTAHYDVTFSSHQLVSLVSAGNFVEKLVYYGLYVIVLSLKLPFILLYISILLGGIVKIVFFEIIFRKRFRPLLPRVEKTGNFKLQSTNKMFLLQISITVINSSTTIIISHLYRLSLVSVYSVYAYINTAILLLLNMMKNAVSPGFGNLAASEDEKRTSEAFQNMHYLFILTGCFLYICMGFLFMPFIRLYTSGITDENYIVPSLVFFVMINSIANSLSMPFFMITEAFGLFKISYKFEIPLAALSVVASFLCGRFWSLPSVLVGPFLFYFVSFVYLAILLKKRKPGFSMSYIFRRTAIIFVVPLSVFFLQNYVLKYFLSSWFEWILAGVVTAFSSAAIMALYSIIFERKDLRKTAGYLKSLIKSR